jgi:hypothetical protein
VSNREDIFDFHNHGNDNLIIWFAGIDEPLMSDNLAKATQCDVLAISDRKNLWYMQGALPEHQSVNDCADWLTNMSANYKNKIFIGQSSGGYGALLFGQICSADLIIAFSPQTMNVRTGQCDLIPRNEIINVNNIYDKHSHSCPVIINIGQSESDHSDDFFWDDWRHINKFLDFPFVTLMVHPHNNHNTSGILKRNNILYKLVHFFISAYTEK